MIKKFFRLVFEVVNGSLKDNIGAFSAQSAFFMTISFIPLIMLFLSLLKFIPIPVDLIIQGAVSVFPGGAKELVSSFINETFEKSDAAVISITAVSTLWAASIGVFSLIKGLNKVYHTDETRNYFVVRVMSMFYTLIFLIILVLCLLLFVFGNTITEAIEKLLPHGFGEAALILSGRFLVGTIVLGVLFLLIYTIVPNRKTKFLTQIPGAIVSALGWLAFSWVFSFYYENMADYSYLYGSLSVMVFFMLWLFICIYILFIGAEINKCIEDRTERNFLLKK